MTVKLSVDLNAVLDSVNECLESEANKIVALLKNDKQHMQKDSLFEYNNSMGIKNENSIVNVDCCKNRSGIYVFKLTQKVKMGNFNDTSYALQIKDEFLGKNCFNKDEILYLGKSEKDISARVNQHIKNSTAKTYSLRLNDENRRHLYGKLEVLFLC